MDGGREERPKREIVTTELVAGADFFHHLPCAPEDNNWRDRERVRVKPRPQHTTTKHNAHCDRYKHNNVTLKQTRLWC